ncbi:hypothetical protein OIDMADRAFT_55121 [Oidiodendron maius Zn]|uniref:Uncharacterized protein n=1 Tax=Oidiodendron maius (strain Zn) TaxID=913774 RepID=A0A0C3HE17_OIDMZ|nr:hypothetical protein OIDMADRAFT_55121 [Oidiodendron maius Zn]
MSPYYKTHFILSRGIFQEEWCLCRVAASVVAAPLLLAEGLLAEDGMVMLQPSTNSNTKSPPSKGKFGSLNDLPNINTFAAGGHGPAVNVHPLPDLPHVVIKV